MVVTFHVFANSTAWFKVGQPNFSTGRPYHFVGREIDLLDRSQVPNTNERRTETIRVWSL